MSTPSTPRPCNRPDSQHTALSESELAEYEVRLRNYIEAQGLKQSEQRWTIAREVLRSGRHLNSQDVVRLVQAIQPGIGAATVYRNLKLLTEARILRENSLADQTFYEPFHEGHHDHVICTDCGRIFEFHDETIERAQEQVLSQLGFKEVRHRHVLYAQCLEKNELPPTTMKSDS